ncbi:diguanylate cyclase [Candidatus Avelusimicrobium facis]|uniref:GGDEF domain-containing protein n=1 Tax=Candidatus Avelusimicrobium facis TaxID=3416203 RepID=UPI0015B77613
MFDKEAFTLFQFGKKLNQSFQNRRELLDCALPALRDLFKLDRVYFFNWQQERALLSLNMMCKKEYCMDMQEDISVLNEPEFLKKLLQDGIADSTDLNYPAVYVLLKWQRPSMVLQGEDIQTVIKKSVGVLRLERLRKNRVFTPADKHLIKAVAAEISHNLTNTEIDQAKNQRLSVATALNDLATVFASSLRLSDGLELILQGVQKYFRFDRVRLYQTNYDGTKIKTILGVDISGEVTRQTGEDLPEDERTLLGEIFNSGAAYRTIHNVVYIPLKVQRNKVGFLTFDNLLSRRRIDYFDFISLKQFSSQIALAIDNAALFERVQELSNYDELTKLPVRRFFNEKFAEEIYRSKRFDLIMSVIVLDIDLFKQINDTYGHQIGDWALKEVSRVIRTSLRQTDFPCRYGGDEMVIMLPRTNDEEAKIIAKRLKDRINAITIPDRYTDGEKVPLSISQGISSFPQDGQNATELFEKADRALYWVKDGRRGTFAVYREVAADVAE